jgi:hypothetical protein
MDTPRILAALAINPTKYLNDFTAVLSRIDKDMRNDYPRRSGALEAHAKFNAEYADNERMKRLRLERDPVALVNCFFRHNPTLDDIHTMLCAMNDAIADMRFDGEVCVDLGDALTDLEDFMSAYNESPERDAEKRAEIAEARADARRDDV